MGNRTAGLRLRLGARGRASGKPQNRLVANQLPLHVNKRRVVGGSGVGESGTAAAVENKMRTVRNS